LEYHTKLKGDKKMKTRKILYADEGKILTDGTHYGKVIYLADGADEYAYHEIAEAEYEAIVAEQEREQPPI
jgi:hypothetical protein